MTTISLSRDLPRCRNSRQKEQENYVLSLLPMILKHETSPMPINSEDQQNVNQLTPDKRIHITHLMEEENIKLFMK